MGISIFVVNPDPMIRIVCSFLMLFPISFSVQEKEIIGFYILIPDQKNCPQVFSSMDNQRIFCVTQKPILGESAFESVGNIRMGVKTKYIEVFLSKNGMDALKKLVARLPQTNLVLVVNHKAVGVLHDKDLLGRFIRIDGPQHSTEINWIYDQLKLKL